MTWHVCCHGSFMSLRSFECECVCGIYAISCHCAAHNAQCKEQMQRISTHMRSTHVPAPPPRAGSLTVIWHTDRVGKTPPLPRRARAHDHGTLALALHAVLGVFAVVAERHFDAPRALRHRSSVRGGARHRTRSQPPAPRALPRLKLRRDDVVT